MLNEKQKELLTFLKKYNGQWVVSNELASFSGCTTRTIRNRVAQINQEHPGLVLTSNRGYRLNQQIPTNSGDEVGERKSRIFLELLKKSSEGVPIYELSESLFISETTLKSDIQQLKREMTDNNIQIVFDHSCIKLTGTERAKRRYMISLLYNESDLQEKLKTSIQEMIGYISLDELQDTIRGVLRQHDIQINQYSMNNIVLHYAISIERIRQGHIIKPRRDSRSLQNTLEYQRAKEIADRLGAAYQLNVYESELEQLALLFIGMQNETSTNTCDQQLEEFVDQKIITTLHSVLEQVEQTYLIELRDEEFFNKLAIHLQSLYYRSHYETFTRNSSLLDLKIGYPLTYDLSVYISSLIQEGLGIWFNDDEISFIALHIGAFLETQKNNDHKLSVLLIVNDYHDLGRQLQQKLEAKFSDDVRLVIAHSNAPNPEWTSCDLVLTTNRSLASEYAGSVFVHPFLTASDLRKIEKRVAALLAQKQKQKMYHTIDQFIMPDLFFNQVDPAGLTPRELRQQMYQRLIEEGYMDEAFTRSVEKRERMSPTSFPSGIAVPHGVELAGLKSGVAIMTLQEDIIWSGYPVKLIALIAINKEEAKAFNAFFERFIEIVSEEVHTKQLSMAEDYASFILRLKMMVDASE